MVSILFNPLLYIADRVADIMRRRGQGTISMTALSSEDEFESELVLNDFGNTSTCFLKGAGQYSYVNNWCFEQGRLCYCILNVFQ